MDYNTEHRLGQDADVQRDDIPFVHYDTEKEFLDAKLQYVQDIISYLEFQIDYTEDKDYVEEFLSLVDKYLPALDMCMKMFNERERLTLGASKNSKPWER